MTMNRALLSVALVLILPNPAAAQRFAGVMDAGGMVARPTAPPTVTPIPGLPMIVPGTVLMPPARPGFFTPGTIPQIAPADTLALNNVARSVFIPVPATVAPTEVIEEEPLDGDVIPAVRSDARMLPARPTRGSTVFSAAEPTQGSAMGRCQTATLRQLRAMNVRADDLRFGANSTIGTTLSEAEVRGGGILWDGNRGQWRRFRYVCESGTSTAQTRSIVTLEPAR